MRTTFLGAAAFCLIGQAAFAHAHLQSSSPPASSTLRTSPSSVTITFSEAVEPKFSTIAVQNADGVRFDKGDLHPIGNRQLSIGVPNLARGRYIVVWHVTSVDTHRTEGQFSFNILP